MIDPDDLTDEQLESLIAALSAFACWGEVRRLYPDDAPFDAYAQALMGAEDFREAAVDFLSVAQAVREAGRKPRLYVAEDD
jgi:hypothetical protein